MSNSSGVALSRANEVRKGRAEARAERSRSRDGTSRSRGFAAVGEQEEEEEEVEEEEEEEDDGAWAVKGTKALKKLAVKKKRDKRGVPQHQQQSQKPPLSTVAPGPPVAIKAAVAVAIKGQIDGGGTRLGARASGSGRSGGRRSSSRGPEDEDLDEEEDEEDEYEEEGEGEGEGDEEGEDDDLRRREEEDLSGYHGGGANDGQDEAEQAEDEGTKSQKAGESHDPGTPPHLPPSRGGAATKGAGARVKRSHPVVVCMVGEPNVSALLAEGWRAALKGWSGCRYESNFTEACAPNSSAC